MGAFGGGGIIRAFEFAQQDRLFAYLDCFSGIAQTLLRVQACSRSEEPLTVHRPSNRTPLQRLVSR